MFSNIRQAKTKQTKTKTKTVSLTRKTRTDTDMKQQTKCFFSKTPTQIPVVAKLLRRPEGWGFLKHNILPLFYSCNLRCCPVKQGLRDSWRFSTHLKWTVLHEQQGKLHSHSHSYAINQRHDTTQGKIRPRCPNFCSTLPKATAAGGCQKPAWQQGSPSVWSIRAVLRSESRNKNFSTIWSDTICLIQQPLSKGFT